MYQRTDLPEGDGTRGHDAGLVFDVPLLTPYVDSGSDPIRHNPLNAMYKADNVMLSAKMSSGERVDFTVLGEITAGS